jgi:enoyl-CoA hydratase
MQDKLTFTVEDHVAWITLDDGKANVMSHGMLTAVQAALASAETAARVTVLEGRPGIFSAGFDLGTFRRGPEATGEMIAAGVALILQLLEHPHPVVAACTGHAYPMGAFLLLAADHRIGAAGDWRIGLNETAIGITVPPFALALARHRLTPAACARITTATMFGPEAAVAQGYLDEVVPAAELRAACRAAAHDLLTLDPAAFRATKARVNAAVCGEIERAPGF